ncbi:acetate-CoA ligase [Acanthamoeba castellanii str. Neff]|uniref:acetate--CoA ligase n=1 Tax=Acanthamoeba castellanii (strain ATCC 30010 / Neff) TaxID=1257118 RepID=L8HK49_ACACF|nr:acetate-CoA ligase [Acanthamoeba castellanii str. Neff]ELR25048.1 acetate-CoA ligase [Acanthamoeba castellanii str. Neff]
MEDHDLEILKQVEIYQPPADIASRAHVKSLDEYNKLYEKSVTDPDAFWGEIAERDFYWHQKWSKVSSYNIDVKQGPVKIEWFVGAKTNICYNAVDRHVEAGKGEQVAFYWEGNDEGEDKVWTYSMLKSEVCKFANVLKSLGVKKGDRVAVYLPMIVELPVVLLACARIGAIHSVVFSGFSAEALANRLLDSEAKILISADAVLRGNKPVLLKQAADEALALCAKTGLQIKHIVYKRLGDRVPAHMKPERDMWYHELMAAASEDCPVEWLDAEDPLFMLYTSGSTGRPKGVLHTTGGYMVYAATTHKYIFDYHPGDVYYCTADLGWVTGHSYIMYGPLCNGAASVLFEGVPTWPDAGRFWAIVEKYKVTQFYTAPTAIRALMRLGEGPVKKYNRDSLRILGSVGEPINPEAWLWYHRVVGDSRCAIVDTWWQTETGGILITPLPGATPTKPGSATKPFFGVQPVVLDEKGQVQEGPCAGYLAISRPWPGIMRTVYGDHARFEQTYGYYWLTGRIDDVMNVSGHRLGTAEVESALVSHQAVAEAAVVPYPHDIKGEGIYAYVTLRENFDYSPKLRQELMFHTRSGKIMRRILRKITTDQTSPEHLGDISTLADPGVVEVLIDMKGK